MRARWVAVLAATALLAGCGTSAPRPVPRTTGTAAVPRATGTAAVPRATRTAVSRAPVGSRAAALTLARLMLSRLVLPPGSRPAQPSPVPAPLSVPSGGGALPYTVELHRFILVPEPMAIVQSFLLGHMPAGMSWAGTGLGEGTTNTVTVPSVSYRPRSLPAGLTDAALETDALPSAGGDTLVRANAGVSWFPPRSAAEQLNAASFRSVTITVVQVIPDKRTVTRRFASPAVIGQLVALADSLPATPNQDVAAMSCLAPIVVYRLDLIPGVVIDLDGCGESDAIAVDGKQQPRLFDPDTLIMAARKLLRLPADF
jgi:hypothetical protein